MIKNYKLVYGVGINDSVEPISKKLKIDGKWKTVWTCPIYTCWSNMIQRCYSSDYHLKKPSYVGCVTTEEWIYFTNFRSWMEKQDWKDKELDKDLLFPGNKIYGPDTCCFLNSAVNSFNKKQSTGR